MHIDRKIRLNNWYLFVLSLFSLLIIFVSVVSMLNKFDDILAIVLLSVFSTFGFVVFFRNYAQTFMIILFCFLIFLTGFNYHYFKVSDNYLVVRNLIYFWKRKVFRLDNIESVNYGASGDSAIVSGLKINTKDYKQHFFASGLTKDSKIMILNRINKNNKA